MGFILLLSIHLRAFALLVTAFIGLIFFVKNKAFFRKIEPPQIRGKLIRVAGMGVVKFVKGDFAVFKLSHTRIYAQILVSPTVFEMNVGEVFRELLNNGHCP